jgi:hypothetical protein
MPDGIKNSRINKFTYGEPSLSPVGNDFHYNYPKDKESNPADILKISDPNEAEKIRDFYEKHLFNEMCGNYLDIPESEPDNGEAFIGYTDKENNYYCFGGHDPNDVIR